MASVYRIKGNFNFVMSSYILVRPKGKVITSNSVVFQPNFQQTTWYANGRTSAIYSTVLQ